MHENKLIDSNPPESFRGAPSGDGFTTDGKKRVTRRRLVRAGAAVATVAAATVYTSPNIRSFKITKTASAFSF